MKHVSFSVSVFLFLALPGALRAQVPTYPLEGLVVTASPTPRPADAVASHVTVLDGAELRARGLREVQSVLREVAGLSIVQSGSYGGVTSVFFRGGESDHTLVLLDGVQINQPGGAVDLAGLTLEDVERIEVVRGPASALYGSDAVAGVIHVITRTGRGAPSLSVSTRAGSYGRLEGSAALAGGGERAGYGLAFTRTHTDGTLPFNNRYENSVLSGTLRFDPDGETSARLSVRLGDRRYHYPTDGSGAVVDRNAFTFGDEATVSLGMTRRLTDALHLQALLGVNQTDGGTDDAADGPADSLGFYGFNSLDHLRRSSADVRANWSVDGATLTLGGELEEARQRSFTESLSQYGPSGDRSAFSRWNRALYGHATGERGPWAFNVGARLEDNERFGRLGTWQVGAAVRVPGTPTRFRASAGRAIKEPTFFENYATGFATGNPDLSPERSVSWEVGVDQTLASGRVRLGVTYFDQSYRDLIQYTFSPPSPTDPNFFNVAAASSRGTEADLGVSLGRVSARASWTWLHTEVDDAGFDAGPGATFVAGEPLIRRPRHTLTASATVQAGGDATLTVGATRVGARADRDFSAFPAAPVTLSAYTDLFAGGEAGILGGDGDGTAVTLTFRGENLLDRAYDQVFGFRAPGRALTVGARVTLGGD
jgi:vitamin B12 transporter